MRRLHGESKQEDDEISRSPALSCHLELATYCESRHLSAATFARHLIACLFRRPS